MNVIFYQLPPEKIGLKFENSTQRDAFWKRLGETERNGITGQHAAELIGNRTIRFHAELIEEGFEWNLNGEATSPVNLETQPVSSGHQPSANSGDPAMAAASPNPESIVTSNPFGFAAHITSKPLPGLVPAPPAEMLAPMEPPPPPEPVEARTPPAPFSTDDSNDPKPIGVHWRSKIYTEWLKRQKAREALAKIKQ